MPKRKLESVAEMAVQVASQAIASTLSPKLSCSPGASPGRAIENCSKCYRQLSELSNLKSSGVLTLEEYEAEKKSSYERIERDSLIKRCSHNILPMLYSHTQ